MTRSPLVFHAALLLAFALSQSPSAQNVVISADIPARDLREMPRGNGLILGRTVDPALCVAVIAAMFVGGAVVIGLVAETVGVGWNAGLLIFTLPVALAALMMTVRRWIGSHGSAELRATRR
jgi:hypothetical protein